ncbi:MAG: UPF0175 family protein [Ardenticatenales bacterium]|nr:UPF0175 family protein [Ardenticatenales bacterium]
MQAVQVELNEQLVALLQALNRPVHETAQELIVIELYRQRRISSGKAAELLDMSRDAFIAYTSRLGIPFFDMTMDEWAAERQRLEMIQ